MPEDPNYEYSVWMIEKGAEKYKGPGEKHFHANIVFHSDTHARDGLTLQTFTLPFFVNPPPNTWANDPKMKYALGMPMTFHELRAVGIAHVDPKNEHIPEYIKKGYKIVFHGHLHEHQPPKRLGGRLFWAKRGKQLVIACGNYIICIGLGTQGHLMWLKNRIRKRLTANGAQPIVNSTTGGKTYYIPVDMQGKPTTERQLESRHLRLALTLEGEEYSLGVIDHNMSALRMRITKWHAIQEGDLVPGSKIWKHLFDDTHGPDWKRELDLAKQAYFKWIKDNARSTMWVARAMMIDNKATNGIGEWLTNHILGAAFISPFYSMSDLAANETRQQELLDTIVRVLHSYDPTKTLEGAPQTSLFDGESFAFPESGQRSWNDYVQVYRKETMKVSPSKLQELNMRGLLNENYTLDANGNGRWMSDDGLPDPTSPPSKSIKSTLLPIFHIKVGQKDEHFYSPIPVVPASLKANPDLHIELVENSLMTASRVPAIGPYSYYVFTSGRVIGQQVKAGRPAKGNSTGGRKPTGMTKKKQEGLLKGASIENTDYVKRQKRKAIEAKLDTSSNGDGMLIGTDNDTSSAVSTPESTSASPTSIAASGSSSSGRITRSKAKKVKLVAEN